MASENRLAVIIFSLLVAIVVIPLAYRGIKERLRPRLVEARIVTATDHDPVFRDGLRHVPPDQRVDVAVALRLERFGGRSTWLAPVTDLNLDGQPVDHAKNSEWPDSSREVRVFWFTVECTNVGGEIATDNAARRMTYRTFLAPEMGRGLFAENYPEAHNDDHLGLPPETTPVEAGTLRFYARVEVFDPEHDVRPEQAASTFGVDRLLDPAFPTTMRAGSFPNSVHPSVGELFLLPGYKPVADPAEAWNDVTTVALGMSFTDLVERRLVASSRTFASTALAGTPEIDPNELIHLGGASWDGDQIKRGGRSLAWQDDIEPGDVLRDGTHWMVVLEDDGNGVLDTADTMIHCWGRPGAMTTLGAVLGVDPVRLEVVRHAG
jgi:hypothetical protein